MRSGEEQPAPVVPEDLRKALAAAPRAKAQWSALTSTERRDFIDWIETLTCVALLLAFCCGAPAAARGEPQYFAVRMRSELLSEFWGRPVAMTAHVLFPDSYYKDPARRYPVMYWIQGFDGTGDMDVSTELAWQRPMRSQHVEFIVIELNGMFNGGHDEFADSANNGPWGSALTTEFIPETDAHFRTLPNASSRFVGGHSSGGWAALWLQITYPNVFGSEWSVSPDPVDFQDFTGPDLTRSPPQNFFHDGAGHPYTVDQQTLEAFVNGPGWEHRQFNSFDAVFSPRLPNGTPAPLFDRRTGRIDPSVQAYWDAHFDIAEILRTHWGTLGPLLHGKLHIIVGTADEYGLNRPVRLLQRELRSLGSDAEFDYDDGATHESVFQWHGGLGAYIISEAAALLRN